MHRNKLDLEKIHASLDTICTLCGFAISPPMCSARISSTSTARTAERTLFRLRRSAEGLKHKRTDDLATICSEDEKVMTIPVIKASRHPQCTFCFVFAVSCARKQRPAEG